MARMISLPKFGAELRALRGSDSRGKVCKALLRYGLKIDRSTLLHYERGAVSAPDPAILWALARIYQTSIDSLLNLLHKERTGRTVPGRLAHGGLDQKQLEVAEWFGALPPELHDALYVLIREVAASPANSAKVISRLVPTRRRRGA